ncbi:MAG: response regulator [Bacteroidota bacterium]|nr:response regulator [Bacteroidota bacterium]
MRKILIIEDDLPLRESIKEVLEMEGYKVVSADNGEEGLKIVTLDIYDLIICDITMPKMDGYEVYRLIKENPLTTNIPFVFLTAKAEKEDIRMGLQLGADDYITKPFDFDELLTTVARRIEKHEKLIKSVEDKFRVLFENSLTGVLIYQELKLIYVNQKFTKILGYSGDELLNTYFSDLVFGEDRDSFFGKLNKCLKGFEKTIHTKVKLLNSNRKCVSFEFYGGLSIINGKPSIVGNLMEIKSPTKEDEKEESISIRDFEKMANLILENKEYLSLELIDKLNELNKDKTQEQVNPVVIEGLLSKREIEILRCICDGLSNNEIGEKLFISKRTVDGHRANIMFKTGAKNTADLVMYAIKHELIVK